MCNRMAKKNGTIWKKIAVCTTIAVLVYAVISGYVALSHQVGDNEKMQPEVKKNTEHRLRFEEKVSNIERDVSKILEKVEKL